MIDNKKEINNVTKIPITNENEILMVLSDLLEKAKNKEITDLIITSRMKNGKLNEYYNVDDSSWAITRLELIKLDILTQTAMCEDGEDADE